MQELLTVLEAAALARVHPGTIRRWLQEGRLKAIKIGRQWRIEPAALLQVKEGRGPWT